MTAIPEVVGFGMITPVVILVVDELPPHNTGALIRGASEYIFDDAAIVACLLRDWDVQTGLIGTTLGDDPRGRRIVRQLKHKGVLGNVRLSRQIATPLEVDISDLTGARTYFWQREPHVLKTLDSADLSLLAGARVLYVDWYDGDHILRAMDEAIRLDIPVFLNLEHGHADPDILPRYAGRATFCQAVTDAAQLGHESPLAVAQNLLAEGVQIALITLAGDGCLVASQDQVLQVRAPHVDVLDGCGAGATFSASFIYGYLRGWELGDIARFAVASASLKCARIGLQLSPLADVWQLANELKIERLTRDILE